MSLPTGGPRPAPAAPPRAAAVAGVVFSVLLIISLVLIRLAVPADPSDPHPWGTDPTSLNAISLALNLIPFAGIAFLWFMGVLRNRLGAQEDQFFATVFLGSGLLFVATLFGSAAWAGGLLSAITAGSIQLADNDSLVVLVRETSFVLMNVFGIKMAGVFMFSTCTIALRTGIMPRWIVLVGYAFAVVLLLVITRWPWIALLFPLWILLASAYILFETFGQGQAAAASGGVVKPGRRGGAMLSRRVKGR